MFNTNTYEKAQTKTPTSYARAVAHPSEIIHDGTLSNSEKRSILASWASDAHAVEDAPTLRQLDSGAIVDLDVILLALQALDAKDVAEAGAARQAADSMGKRGAGRYKAIRTYWRKRPNSARSRDDDDPPPCPASNALPVRPCFVPAFGRLAA